MRLIQDVYSKKLLQEALDPVDVVELQKPIAPHDEQYSDVYCQPRPNRPPREEVPHLGLLWDMTAKRCTVEPSSKTPTVNVLRSYARKQLNLHHQLCKDDADENAPVPPQWVISPGRPSSGLLAVPATPAEGWPPGFHRSGELLEQWIVVLSELPKTAETRLLRLMGPQPMRREVQAEIVALSEDDPVRQPWVVILSKMVYFLVKKIEGAGEETEDMTQLDQEFEQFKADLRSEGEIRGEARGKAKALLSVMAARGMMVNDIVRSQILACQDLASLDRWLERAATATSATEVIAAAS